MAYDIFTKNLRIFAGNGNNELTDRPCVDTSFGQPCGLAVEFDNATYVTDVMPASLSMITTTNNTANFLKNVEALYDTFSIHERGKEYKQSIIEEAHCLISNCVTTLETNQQKIVKDVKEKLPKVLNGPEGNVAQKTIESVKMIEWAVSRLIRLQRNTTLDKQTYKVV